MNARQRQLLKIEIDTRRREVQPTPSKRRRYATEAERLEARRATYRASAARKYDLYRDICARHGIAPRWERWMSHLAEIRHLPPPQEMREWWLATFSSDEIEALAAQLDGGL